jgi:hypothetical protein
LLKDSEARSKAAAKPVAAGTQEDASASRGHQVITLKKQLPPGIRFARAAMCVAASKGSRGDAVELAKEQYPDDPGIAQFVKAAVGAGTGQWAGSAAQYTDFMAISWIICGRVHRRQVRHERERRADSGLAEGAI